MAQAAVEVPEMLVGAVRDTVVLLYDSTLEALHLALGAHLDGGGRRDEVVRSRARLAELDALLARLGWWSDAAPGDVELTAPRELLHDALYGALIEAGERLAAACDESWRGGPSRGRVRAAAMEVIALDQVLAEIRA
jgi:hypothetical protein